MFIRNHGTIMGRCKTTGGITVAGYFVDTTSARHGLCPRHLSVLRTDFDVLQTSVGFARVLVHDFRRRAHHYIQSPPSPDEHLEWLALVQHHGGPTRLLDFTKSFYVASFFAVETAHEDACVGPSMKWT